MFFFDIFEVVLAIFLAILLTFQVIIPIWNGTVWFPSFRSKTRRLKKELAQARLNIELAEEQKKLRELQEEAKPEKEDQQ